MKHLPLTDEQVDILREVLENDLAELRKEEAHTTTREYRKILKHKEEILAEILAGIVSEETAAAV